MNAAKDLRCIEKLPFSFPATPQGKLKTRAEKGKWKRSHHFQQYSRPPRPAYLVQAGLRARALGPSVLHLVTRVFRLPIRVDSGWVKNREALTVAGAAQALSRFWVVSHLFPVSLREEHLKRAEV